MSRIVKRDKGYFAEFTKGAGKTRYRKQKTFKKKSDAEEWLIEMEHEYKQGGGISSKADMLFAEYYKQWITMYKSPIVSANTIDGYRSSHSRISSNRLGQIKLRDLTRDDIQIYFNNLNKSHETARKDLNRIRACLRDAFNDGIIQRNPSTGSINIIADPNLTKGNDRKFMAIKDFRNLQKYLLNSSYNLLDVNRVILFVISQTAMRVGECLALKEDDIDEINCTLRVDESWDSHHKILKQPKTQNSIRVLPVSREVMNKLTEWVRYHRKELFKRGIRNKDKLIFLNYKSKLPMSASINITYKRLQQKLGLTGVFSTHTMRHTIASMMLNSGEISLVYISRFLGHSNVSITQKYYIDLLPDQVANEDKKVVKLLAFV